MSDVGAGVMGWSFLGEGWERACVKETRAYETVARGKKESRDEEVANYNVLWESN
jgi:hypothetical protein